MTPRSRARRLATWAAAGAGAAAGAYAACAALAWWRYGRPGAAADGDGDALLDALMPIYDVVDRHRVRVAAPPSATLAAARETDLMGVPAIRAIFAARSRLLCAASDETARPRGLVEWAQSIGWRVVAEVPDREIVFAAVTRPWEANPRFEGLDRDAFVTCRTPEAVKIAWTLRADPDGDGHSLFRTETRAVATDAAARARFRRYWALVSPGIRLIRRFVLAPVKAAAERRC